MWLFRASHKASTYSSSQAAKGLEQGLGMQEESETAMSFEL